MYGKEFAAALAERTGLNEADADKFMREILGLLTETWCSGRSVSIRGFGDFFLRGKSEQEKGLNFRTMAPHPLPAYVPAFRISRKARLYISEQLRSRQED